MEDALKEIHGVIIPGGFGPRGAEGKIAVIKYVRENNIPFLGLCYGLQLAVAEKFNSVDEEYKITLNKCWQEGLLFQDIEDIEKVIVNGQTNYRYNKD